MLNEKSMNIILNTLQPVLNSISKLSGEWVKFIDHSGKYIATTQSKEQCEFCKYTPCVRIVVIDLKKNYS